MSLVLPCLMKTESFVPALSQSGLNPQARRERLNGFRELTACKLASILPLPGRSNCRNNQQQVSCAAHEARSSRLYRQWELAETGQDFFHAFGAGGQLLVGK